MFFMIFVNDLWTLNGVPKWLEHAQWNEDYLGFSDIIFPLFLFIIGLSIPFAFASRKAKQESDIKIAFHILIRSLSLIIMGLFMVNGESLNDETMILSEGVWDILMATAMALVWIDWKRSNASKAWGTIFQVVGAIILILLAIVYQGGDDGNEWMKISWWGILGLLGWAYLAGSLVYLFSKGKLSVLIISVLVFNFLNIADHANWIPDLNFLGSIFGPVISGSGPALVSAGMLASGILLRNQEDEKQRKLAITLLSLTIISLSYAFIFKPLWGISKIMATPSWVGISCAIGFAATYFLYVLADRKGISNWAKIIRPAGTATLTCYLLPYFIYPIRDFCHLVLPEFLRTGCIGIAKSLLFSLFVVLLAGWFESKKLKLKL